MRRLLIRRSFLTLVLVGAFAAPAFAQIDDEADYTNLAESTLASGIDDDDTTFAVAAGHGARFPSTASGFIWLMIEQSGTVEIVKCDTRTSDTFSDCTREAQEPSRFPASAFTTGANVYAPLTADTLNELKSLKISDSTWSGANDFTRSVTQHTTWETGLKVALTSVFNATNNEDAFGLHGQLYIDPVTHANSTGVHSSGLRGTFAGAGTNAGGSLNAGSGVIGFCSNQGLGTIVTCASFRAQAPINTGGGSLTNTYGFYQETAAVGTNKYGAYFAHPVGIGIATPTVGLHVATGTATFGLAGTAAAALRLENATSGSLTLAPPTGALGTVTVTVPAATDTLVGKATTDILTNKTLDAEGTGNVLTLPVRFEYTPAVCQNGVASIGLSVGSVAPTPECVTGSNTNFGVARYPDSDGDYDLQSHFYLPSDWTGNIDMSGKYRGSGTTGNVVWQLQTICVADAETADPAFNTAQAITDAQKGTTLQTNDFSQATVTVTGCAAGEQLFWRLRRQRTHASDTATGTLDLISLVFTVRRAI